MPLRWLVHLIALGAVWFGLQETWIWLRDRTPTPVTCGAFAATRPSAAWLEVSGCVAEYGEATRVSKTRRGGGSERGIRWLVPLRAEGDTRESPVHLVTEVPDTVASLLEQVYGLSQGRPDPAADSAVRAFVATHADELAPATTTVRGMLADGLHGDDKLEELFDREQPWTLAADWALLLPGKTPEGPGSIVVALLGGLWLMYTWRKWRRSMADADAQAAAAAAAGPVRVADLAEPPA